MVELLILWNVAAFRAEQREAGSQTFAIVGAWIMLQLLIWPTSLLVILRKTGLSWLLSLIAASAFTAIGYLLWGENFYFLIGAIAIVASASVVAYVVVSDA